MNLGLLNLHSGEKFGAPTYPVTLVFLREIGANRQGGSYPLHRPAAF